ncbi:WxL domain-containing protein [Bombilactobacillus bombi]|uniref:WxL domain-containing protein n=1 Tax=Bombilactobacillus bombi TaxID=1303590 RepID=UPI0015E59E9F|nr:WxL domain-containing protein [Bombilactobacillus bombi]MBA1434444.1 hypothetical protein [Bombilactobacillus bombi]
MRIKEISIAASALALFSVAAPLVVQTANAADRSGALSGVAGVQDYSGSQIINSSASADANRSGMASGKSFAGIGFDSGDLILYQVPNFDFGMGNAMASNGVINLIAAKDDASSNRMAVIVDNRYTQAEVDAANTAGKTLKYNWSLSANATDFKDQATTGRGADLIGVGANHDAQIILSDTDNKGKLAEVYKAETQNLASKPNIYKVYKKSGSATGVDVKKGANISAGEAVVAKTLSDGKTPGPYAVDFKDVDSANVLLTQSALTKIVPKHNYVSNITWTLSTSPLLP